MNNVTISATRTAKPGYSITELLIVFGIIAAVMGGVFFLGRQVMDTMKKNSTQSTLYALNTYIQQFHTDTGQYPKALRDLVTKPQGEEFSGWDGPYGGKKAQTMLKDAWGKPFQYKLTPNGKHEYELYTKTPRGAMLSAQEE